MDQETNQDNPKPQQGVKLSRANQQKPQSVLEKSEEFLSKYRALCREYGLAILPRYQGEVSLHDPMSVEVMDRQIKDYIEQRIYTNP